MNTIQPPFVGIAQLLRTSRVVPFLGAGVNTRPSDAAGWTRAAPFLPRGAELARDLADINGFPSEEPGDRGDLAKVASYGVEYLGRLWLRDALRQVFDRDYEPCDIHTYLASVPAPLLVVTTNYDDLTERAFERAGRAFDLVVHPTDNDEYAASVLWTKHGERAPVPVKPNLLQIDLAATTVIYKMHGNVYRRGPADAAQAWDSYVITEDDYVDFLSRMTGQTAVPSIFIRHFRDRQFLFLGYGLNDWNLRVVLRNLRNVLPEADGGGARRGQQPSWAIQFGPSPLEVALWGARGVKIFDMSIDEFVRGLRAAAPGGGA
jgi:SIR2-like domain